VTVTFPFVRMEPAGMTDLDDPPELLTTSDVAQIFNVSSSAVAGWAARGLLPHIRTPTGRLRFRRDDIDEILASGRRDAEPPEPPTAGAT
jgi:excisionase family DNA binding protein